MDRNPQLHIMSHLECFSTPSKQRKRKHDFDYFNLITTPQQPRTGDTKFIIISFVMISIFISFTILSHTEIAEHQNTNSRIMKHKFREIDQKNHELIFRLEKNNSMPTNDHRDLKSNETKNSKLDFIMGGFQKTGSTSILHLFRGNNETNVVPNEMCSYSSNEHAAQLQRLLDNLEVKSETMKRGIKCPAALWNTKGLKKLREINEDIKIIIGVRHPISWFQSFYNYRVTEMHDKDMVIIPPPAQILNGPKSWKGVSTFGARFEIPLMQLGKAELDPQDLSLVKAFRRKQVVQNSFKIFLYHIDQLNDGNEERSRIFKRDLQDFLNLKEPIGQIPKSNINHFTHENKHPETIDICEAQYEDLRVELKKNGELSNQWIRSKFIHHEDVIVGGQEYFLELIDGWGIDPCLTNDFIIEK